MINIKVIFWLLGLMASIAQCLKCGILVSECEFVVTNDNNWQLFNACPELPICQKNRQLIRTTDNGIQKCCCLDESPSSEPPRNDCGSELETWNPTTGTCSWECEIVKTYCSGPSPLSICNSVPEDIYSTCIGISSDSPSSEPPRNDCGSELETWNPTTGKCSWECEIVKTYCSGPSPLSICNSVPEDIYFTCIGISSDSPSSEPPRNDCGSELETWNPSTGKCSWECEIVKTYCSGPSPLIICNSVPEDIYFTCIGISSDYSTIPSSDYSKVPSSEVLPSRSLSLI